MKKRFEFSKAIFLGVAAATAAITAFACVVIWRTGDASALAYLVPAVYGELAVGTGFYYAKAKVENRIKLMAAYKMQPDKTDFREV